MKKILLVLIVCILSPALFGQKIAPSVQRVEPPFWWTEMKEPNVQVLVYGKDISATNVEVNYPGVSVSKVHKAESKNFLFVDLTISDDARPGTVVLNFNYGKKKKLTYNFDLKQRDRSRWAFNGLDQGDVLYLVTPDRFVNGDPLNDQVKGMKEGHDRSVPQGRHGGDIQGVISKIDYMHDLGMTALWLNPVLENDMPEYSYHGYAITDYYKVDPRYGSNELYKSLVNKLHEKRMKIVMDMVFNHCGSEHWWMKDMPFTDWIHYYPDHKITNHAMNSLSDPHGAESDRTLMEQGWFVTQMPDLNHDNPFMATYLLQNSIWWIEYAGLDGIRMDTYPYNKKEFMAEWAKRIYKEYPDFYLVGETWVDNEAIESYWAERGSSHAGFNSHLNSITDFPLCNAMHRAFKKEGRLYDVYTVLSKDFLYHDPAMNKIFADNHDMDRFFYTIGEDVDKFKLAMTFLLTTRGVPQFYYGTEILMKGHGDHLLIREDFPGGWTDDKRDAFTAEGRTEAENEVFDHIQRILQWRRDSDAIRNGELKHFVPFDNVYVYNRKSASESVMVIINNNDQTVELKTDRFEEILNGYDGATDILTDKKIDNLDMIRVEGNTSMILTLKPALKAENKK